MKDRPETPTDRARAARGSTLAETEAEKAKREALLDALHAEVLDTPRGRELMTHIRRHTIERRTPPEISDGALRGLEAVRNFVRDIENRISRHREHGGTSKG